MRVCCDAPDGWEFEPRPFFRSEHPYGFFANYITKSKRQRPGLVYHAYVCCGRLAMEMGDNRAALVNFSAAFEYCPRRPEAPGEMAYVYMMLGQPHLAEVFALGCSQIARAVVERGTPREYPERSWKDFRALEILATCYVKTSRLDAAREALTKIYSDCKNFEASKRALRNLELLDNC